MLRVKINSFGYKKSGIPLDDTEHKGGFVFDCRFIYNPGREFKYLHLTGLDKELIEFFEDEIDMQSLLKNVIKIVDLAIDNYLARDFSDIMISFGCTGGQHRSVYASEKLKQHLKSKYLDSIIIEVTHRDLPIKS